jgi:hypothetical protein
VPPTPAAAPSPPEQAAAPGTPAPATNPLTDVSNRFSQEQREKFAAADRLREQKAKAHQKVRAWAAPGPAPKWKSQGFTTGGNKFDPLNATIP